MKVSFGMCEPPNFDSKIKRAFVHGLIVGALLMLGVFGIPMILIQHQTRQIYTKQEQESREAMQEFEEQRRNLQADFENRCAEFEKELKSMQKQMQKTSQEIEEQRKKGDLP